MWLNKLINKRQGKPYCVFCGKQLKAREVEYYGSTCEKCERKLTDRLNKERW